MEPQKITRRVYKPELMQRTGWGDTWLREQEKAGRIPRGKTDPGGKRKWWTNEEADAIVRGELATGEQATTVGVGGVR